MPKLAATHNENRKRVCILCLKKVCRFGCTEVRKIIGDGKVESYINELFKYNSSHEWLPSGICTSCLRKLHRSRNNGEKMAIPDLSEFENTKENIEPNDRNCQCKICRIARANFISGNSFDSKTNVDPAAEANRSTKQGIINSNYAYIIIDI